MLFVYLVLLRCNQTYHSPHASTARSKQSAKASNARRQPGKQRTRATSKAPHVPFLSFPHPLFQVAPTALDERERGPSPTILGIRIQEVQYFETRVPIYPLHAKDTAMQCLICYIVFVLAKNCWFLANFYTNIHNN